MSVVKATAGGTISAEAEKIKAKLRHELHKDLGPVYATVPEEGVAFETLLKQLDELRAKEEPKWKEGFVSGAVYLGEKEFGDFLNKVYILYSSTNALHPDIWPSLRKFESEVVSMSVKLLGGGKDACGLMTSGGTESLVMACKTCVACCVFSF
jgi:sphinganine-1-phosphate aldolase